MNCAGRDDNTVSDGDVVALRMKGNVQSAIERNNNLVKVVCVRVLDERVRPNGENALFASILRAHLIAPLLNSQADLPREHHG